MSSPLTSARLASRKANSESGYALLMILAMAAVVAITLYTQLPKVAFEAQRDKEQRLIDRGEQYSRAIQLFVHKFNRFPATLDELENTNNIRFLRRRYTDPMTGKVDWRFLHAGPGGAITDSILATAKKADPGLQNTNAITTLAPANNDTADPTGVNIGLRVRPSDQQGAGGGDAGGAGGFNPNSGGSPGTAITNGASTNSPGTNGPVMVLPDGTIVPANPSGTAPPTVVGAYAATGIGAPGMINGPLPNGVAIQQNAQNTPPLPPQLGGPSAGATSIINQILTSPRPGGINGVQGISAAQAGLTQTGAAPGAAFGTTTAGTSQPQQQVIGAGLAGVASKREQEGIKSYNERTKYNEWEFVYDLTKDPKFGRGGAAGGTGGQGAAGRGGTTGASPSSTGQTTANPSGGSTMPPGAPAGQ